MRPCIERRPDGTGCPEPTDRTRCAHHERLLARERDRERGTPTERGYDAAYQAARRRVLAASDVCWRCGRPGATTADHVVPLAHGGSSDDENLRACCLSCNASAGANVRRR